MTACSVCDDLGCSRCFPELLKPSPAYLNFVRARDQAAEEGGPVVARVYCSRCGDSGTLATVRRHPRWGLIYEARLVAGVERRPEDRAREAELKRQVGHRVPSMAGLCRHLLDFPAEVPGLYAGTHRQEEPRAECPRCGVDTIDRDELKVTAGTTNGPGVVTIHRAP